MVGAIFAIVSVPAAAGPPDNLAPRVATVYAKARAGALKTTNVQGKPRRMPLGPRFNRAGQVEVDVHYQATAPINALKALGAKIEANVPALATVELFVAPTQLAQAARLPGVVRIAFPHYTFPNGIGNAVGAGAHNSTVDAQAKQIMHVDELRQAIKTSGKAANVLVFSNGADHISDAAKAGVLPRTKTIWVDPKVTGSGDEGTAMLEIVHAIAPNAELGFCGPTTAVQDFRCLNDEAAQFHATIIVSDLDTAGEDAYHGTGAYLKAYREFLGAYPDLVYIHGAGNTAETFFEGPYTPSAGPRTIDGHKYRSVEDFGLATGKASDTDNTFSLPPGENAAIQMQWKDSWTNPSQQYALYLLDSAGNVLASADTQQHPVRIIQYKNKGSDAQTVDLVVACNSGTCDKHFFVKDYPNANVRFEYDTPEASADVIGTLDGVYTVGAVSVTAPTKIEPYSARGPALSDGSIQPAFVAPDCVAYVSVGKFNDPQFCGTSAAAPQVAGVLALLESSPLPGGVQALINGAVDLGASGQDNTYGYGRIDAKAAEASLDTPPTVSSVAGFTVSPGKSHSGKFKGALSATAKQTGLALHYAVLKQPAHGTVKLDATSGAYTYTASSGYSGSDHFTYASSDGLAQSKEQTATASVKPGGSGGGGGGGASNPLELLGLLLLGIPVLIRRNCAFTHGQA
jgi:hypothetical protein